MDEFKIPVRARIETSLTEAEKDCIAWHIISGCGSEWAFVVFCRPELRDSKMLLKKLSSQFYSSEEVIKYTEAYRAVLAASQNGSTKEESAPIKTYTAEERRARKEEAVQRLTDYVIDMSTQIECVANKDEIIKFADKLGLLDNTMDYIESPRRYLPETCSECRYKAFVEEHCVESNE